MTRVAVIGAGIGGLAAATGLRQAGAEVTVFERTPALEPIGAGLSLWPNAVHALRALGVADAVEGAEIPRGASGLWRSDGAPLALEDSAAIERRYGAPLLIVHRAEIQHALTAALDPDPVVLGERLVGLEQDGAGVRATFAGGRTVEADLLIGADGLRSTVRGALLGDEPPRYSGLIAYRAVVEYDTGGPFGEFWGAGAVFGLAPLSRGRVYWYATRRSDEPDDTRVLLSGFEGWAEPIGDVIARTPAERILCHPLYDRPPRGDWTRGRVTLLGDAAHPMLPFLGQGAGQAIEDAVALRDALVAGMSLEAYARQRQARVAPLVKRSRSAGRLAHLRHGWQRRLRDTALRQAPAGLRTRQLDATLQVSGAARAG